MVTGSFASSLQGEPRLTHDIDLVVIIQKEVVKKLVAQFQPPNYHLDQESVVNAVNNKHTFNLINVTEGDKVDFWLLTDEPFDASRFKRRVADEFAGIKIYVSAPEDTILAKLRWAKLSGGSEKQFTDALRVYEVQFNKLDTGYLAYWAKELEVEEMWKRLQEQAQPI